MLRRLVFVISLSVAPLPAFSSEVINTMIPDARVVGEAQLRFAFWNVYHATLFAPEGNWNHGAPFALSLHYMMNIKGDDIADRSVHEMRNQGFTDEIKLAAWHGQMKNIFPDVREGTVLSAVFIPGTQTVFYEGNRQIGVVRDAEFTRWFANIWLGEKTSEPSMRRKLLGRS